MRVTVMSRGNAVMYCYKRHDERTAMISISDPRMQYGHSPFCSKDNNIAAILPLSFSDADRPGADVYGNIVSESDMMQAGDAERIAKFMDLHKGKGIIVHCDAGISRSAGVAAAILKYFTGDDTQIFDNPRFHPNMWCYRKTLEGLQKYNEVA